MSIKTNKVYISGCEAIDCKHNQNKQCVCEETIFINSDFECDSFDVVDYD
jgi:hypothetical protein